MIFPTSDSRVFYSVQEYLATHKVTPKIVAEIQDIELARLMAVDKLGVVPLNRALALNTPNLVILNQNARHDIHESIYIIVKKRKNPHPLIEKIIHDFKLTSNRGC